MEHTRSSDLTRANLTRHVHVATDNLQRQVESRKWTQDGRFFCLPGGRRLLFGLLLGQLFLLLFFHRSVLSRAFQPNLFLTRTTVACRKRTREGCSRRRTTTRSSPTCTSDPSSQTYSVTRSLHLPLRLPSHCLAFHTLSARTAGLAPRQRFASTPPSSFGTGSTGFGSVGACRQVRWASHGRRHSRLWGTFPRSMLAFALGCLHACFMFHAHHDTLCSSKRICLYIVHTLSYSRRMAHLI
jgi:hypothetical protein